MLSLLVGPQDGYLIRIEQRLGVSLALRGNKLELKGPEPEIHYAKVTLLRLYELLKKGQEIDVTAVDTALRFASQKDPLLQENNEVSDINDIAIQTKRRIVFPRSSMQANYIQAIQSHDLVFGLGPAGTGKTYLAVAVGVSLLLSGSIDRIILSRPAVEAGERLGFLPGDMREKVDPYLRPLYDALHDMLPAEQVLKRLTNGEIEIAPLAFMRGRTLSNAFIILDEAQNTTPMQMKMFLTRLGPDSQMVVTGDLTQIDLPPGVTSGLKESVRILEGIEGVSFITFSERDVVRHSLVSKIVKAYDYDKARALEAVEI